MTHLLPPNDDRLKPELQSDDPICMPSQQYQIQTSESPAMQATAEDIIALQYQENGHITLSDTLPEKFTSDMISIYRTLQSSLNDTVLNIHKVWNSKGIRGDS